MHRIAGRATTALAVMALGVVLAACTAAGEGTPSSVTSLSTPGTEATSPPPSSATGQPKVTELLDRLGPEMGTPELFAGDRLQVSPEMEAAYVDAVMGSAQTGEIPTDLAGFSDDELLYLGYFYCLALDAGIRPDVAISGVAASVLAHRGSVDGQVATGDVALALAAANLASTSLCGDHVDETQAYLDTFRP